MTAIRLSHLFQSLPVQASPARAQLVVGFVVCAGLAAGCGASIDPAMQKHVDQRLASVQPDATVHPAPTREQWTPVVGTWGTFKLIDEDGNPSLLTYKVLKQEGDRYWIETVNESYYSRHVMLMRANLGSRTSPEEVDVDRLFQKIDDGAVEQYPSGLLGLMGQLYKPVLARLTMHWVNLPQEDIETPAGTFQQAYRMRVESSVAGFDDTSDVWYHDGAHIGGTVRSISLNNGTRMELIEQGEGAESEIPLP